MVSHIDPVDYSVAVPKSTLSLHFGIARKKNNKNKNENTTTVTNCEYFHNHWLVDGRDSQFSSQIWIAEMIFNRFQWVNWARKVGRMLFVQLCCRTLLSYVTFFLSQIWRGSMTKFCIPNWFKCIQIHLNLLRQCTSYMHHFSGENINLNLNDSDCVWNIYIVLF